MRPVRTNSSAAEIEMKSLYAACLSRLGLSLLQAAELHGVDIATVKHWSAGRRRVRAGVWDELRAYEARIIAASQSLREQWRGQGYREIVRTHTGPDAIALDTAAMMAAAECVLNSSDPVSARPKAVPANANERGLADAPVLSPVLSIAC